MQFEFFKNYLYQYHVLLDSIEIDPIIFHVNYYWWSPGALSVYLQTRTKLGRVSSWVTQINKDFNASLLKPVFDGTPVQNSYAYWYDQPPYYTKYVDGYGGVWQSALWNWSPLSTDEITQTYFYWTII